MKIYREAKKDRLYDFLEKDSHTEGRRRRILAAPPLFAIPLELLKKILENNQVDHRTCSRILEIQKKQIQRMETILSHDFVVDELSEVVEEEYARYPVVLPLADCFLEKDIPLSYEEYRACINAALGYARIQKNYQFILTKVK